MRTRYQVILWSDTNWNHVTELNANLPDEPLLQELRSVIEPYLKVYRPEARLEHVSVLSQSNTRADLFVDDEGAIRRLPVNLLATQIYHRSSIARGEPHTDGVIDGAPMIHGNAVYFPDRRVWF